MKFKEIYEKSITVKKQTGITQDATILIPNQYSYEKLPISDAERSSFLHLLAAGNLFCEDVFHFSFQPMDCCILLYTTAGSGSLTVNGRSVSMTGEQLLFFDCNQLFSLQSTLLPWSFKIFFSQANVLASLNVC